MDTIRVVIADDHEIIRQGLKLLIQAAPDMQVVGEAADGQEVVRILESIQADVVLMDLAMPRLNGIEATRQVLKNSPHSRVLILSSYSGDECVQESLNAGAMGFLTKQSEMTDVQQGIRAVYKGNRYFGTWIAQRIRNQTRSAFEQGHRSTRLTVRELETVKMIAQGAPNKQIAAAMGISKKTVDNHRQSVMSKLNIHETAGLTKYAVDHGLVPTIAPFGERFADRIGLKFGHTPNYSPPEPGRV